MNMTLGDKTENQRIGGSSPIPGRSVIQWKYGIDQVSEYSENE